MVVFANHTHPRLDSPIGGVPDKDYTTLAKMIFQDGVLGIHINGVTCEGLAGKPFKSPDELVHIYQSAFPVPAQDDDSSIPDPQGAAASVLTIPSLKLPTTLPFPSTLGNSIPTNQELAEQAQISLGTSFLTVGNERDFLWKPGFCIGTINTLLHTAFSIPDFHLTQWLEDEGNTSGLYGRDFTAPTGSGITHTCDHSFSNGLNHGEVLNNANVENGILHFLIPTVGGTPHPLDTLPPNVQPE